jgi:hypothetical protein
MSKVTFNHTFVVTPELEEYTINTDICITSCSVSLRFTIEGIYPRFDGSMIDFELQNCKIISPDQRDANVFERTYIKAELSKVIKQLITEKILPRIQVIDE